MGRTGTGLELVLDVTSRVLVRTERGVILSVAGCGA